MTNETEKQSSWGKIKQAIRTALSRFFNSRRAFSYTLISAIIASIVWLSDIYRPAFLVSVAEGLGKHTFLSGILASSIAALLLAWVANIWKVEIRRFFQPQITYIRAPLQLGIAPIIVAKSREVGIWERYGLNMDLDFRYAGIETLDDLYKKDNPTDLAVASDIALCSFLVKRNNPEKELQIIPFVRIEDHLKVVVRKDPRTGELEYTKTRELGGKTIGYYPESVHGDFLEYLEIFDKVKLEKMKSVLDCYRALISGKIGNVESGEADKTTEAVDAVVLWEPHYHAFKEFKHVGIINESDNKLYEWFLCLVATQKYTKRNAYIAQKILAATKEAAAYCQLEKNKTRVLKDCASFLNTEFTGLGYKGLEELLGKNQHEFGVEELIGRFRTKLDGIAKKGGDKAIAVGRLRDCLWEGIKG